MVALKSAGPGAGRSAPELLATSEQVPVQVELVYAWEKSIVEVAPVASEASKVSVSPAGRGGLEGDRYRRRVGGGRLSGCAEGVRPVADQHIAGHAGQLSLGGATPGQVERLGADGDVALTSGIPEPGAAA